MSNDESYFHLNEKSFFNNININNKEEKSNNTKKTNSKNSSNSEKSYES
jgi:hypothetical protein